MPFDGIAEAARLATENAYRNPREITSAGIEKLLSRAFAGNRPLSERSEEHTSELQSLMRISYAVFCLKKQTIPITIHKLHMYKDIYITHSPLYTPKTYIT